MKTARLTRRGGIGRGALAAIVIALVPLVLIGWFVLRGTRAGAPDGGPGLQAPEIAPSGEGGSLKTALADTIRDGRIQLEDKNDPNRRVFAELLLNLEPLEARRYLVETPQAWFFLRDGRIIHLRADRGRLYIPDAMSQQPESGTLEGNVVARLYAKPVGAEKPDLERDTPLGRLDTHSLTFDMALGEVSTPDRVVVTSPELDFAARGVSMLLNEVRERAEWIEIAEGEYITYRPGARKEAAAKPAGDDAAAPTVAPGPTVADANTPGRGGAPAPAGNAPASAPAAAQPTAEAASGTAAEAIEETLYAIVFNREVTVTRGTGVARGDKLEVWARLIGNELPEGAITPIRTAPASQPEAKDEVAEAGEPAEAAAAARQIAATPKNGEAGEETTGAKPAPTASVAAVAADAGAPGATEPGDQVAAAPEGEPDDEEPITLRWTGPCVIRPLAHTPPELEKDHVSLRFTAEQSGLVRFEDAAQQASGHCAVLDYAATTRRMVISGPGPESVLLQTPDHRMATVRAEADLAHGLIYGPSPIVLSVTRGVDEFGRPRVQQLSCTNDYNIVLRMEDGAVTNALQQALFNGNVRVLDGGSSIAGDSLRADFVATERSANSLSRLRVEGKVLARTDEGEQIESRLFDVAFRPGADGDPEPTDFTAEGSVLAQREGERIACERLDALLTRREDGDLAVANALARGNVRFASRREGVTAEADEIRAEPERDLVELVGERAVLTRGGASRVTGTQMRLDGVARRLEVFGAGTFEHREADKGGAAVTATWTTEMVFDDGAGVLECVGDATATSAPDALTRDDVSGSRIRVELEPRRDAAADEDSAATPPWGESGEGRRVLRAIAYGEVLEREDGGPAKVESRRYAAAAPPAVGGPGGAGGAEGAEGERTLERLLYLEGPTIVADNTAGTLDVDRAGRMLIVDARRSEAGGEDGSRLRGSTLFEWAGSLRMLREAGTMDMRRGVRMTHRRLADGEVTDLESERLTAAVRRTGEPGGNDTPEGAEPSGELVSATATGAVYVRSGTRELVADRLEYDARAGTAVASAASGGVVSMFDERTAAPVTAERLFWDMVRDRVEVRRPGPIVAPR